MSNYITDRAQILRKYRTCNILCFKMHFLFTVASYKFVQMKIFPKQDSVHEFGFNLLSSFS